MDIVAEKLKAIRLQQGLSQDLLAKQSGLSLRTIQRLERDGGGSAESLLALAATLNVSPMVLRDEQIPVANWTMASNISNTLTYLTLALLITGVIYLTTMGQVWRFIDIITFGFIFVFVPTVTVIAAGLSGLRLSIYGLSFLFSQQLSGASHFSTLIALYTLQYRLCYSAAFLCNLLGLSSMLQSGAALESAQIYTGLSVLALAWLYTAVIAEIVLRPLRFKLQQAKNAQNSHGA